MLVFIRFIPRKILSPCRNHYYAMRETYLKASTALFYLLEACKGLQMAVKGRRDGYSNFERMNSIACYKTNFFSSRLALWPTTNVDHAYQRVLVLYATLNGRKQSRDGADRGLHGNDCEYSIYSLQIIMFSFKSYYSMQKNIPYEFCSEIFAIGNL